jgi:dienelactone hydrolase
VLGVPLILTIAAYLVLHEYVRAAAFVVRAARVEGLPRAAAGWQSQPVVERSLRVPWRGGELLARWYAPPAVEHPPILLVPGVHASGIDEPRLVGLARDLAAVNHPVLTVRIDDLTRYAITPRSTDMVEDAARWLSSQRPLAPDGRIGIIGISFAGGLGTVAAGRPSVRDQVAFVMSFGGHGDLARTLRYLCTGVLPDGSIRAPHDYGVAVILLGMAGRLVPSDQVLPLRDAINTFLDASRLHLEDPARSEAQFERAREQAAALPEPARTLMELVNARDVSQLGSRLLPHVGDLAADPALSPSRSRPPAADVYLLHGADDNVIPAAEAELLAGDLRARGATVHLLETPLITHAAVDRPPQVSEVWDLVRFWGRLLDER